MNTTITSVRENPLLGRREVEVEVNHEGEPTPSEEDLKNRIAAENDLDTDKIEVETIYTGYGENTSVGTLKVYEEFEYSENLEVSSLDRADASPSSDEELRERSEEEKGAETEEAEETGSEATEEYGEIVSGTITEAKDALNDMEEPDFEAALEAEKDNKDRKTLKEWLEAKIEG